MISTLRLFGNKVEPLEKVRPAAAYMLTIDGHKEFAKYEKLWKEVFQIRWVGQAFAPQRPIRSGKLPGASNTRKIFWRAMTNTTVELTDGKILSRRFLRLFT